MKYLLFDIGSSFIKFTVADIEKKEQVGIKRILMPPNMSTLENRYEIDSEALFSLIKKNIDSYISSHEIHGILFSTQMHAYVLTGSKTGKSSPVITWQDERSLRTDELKEKLGGNSSGFTLKARHPLTKLYHNISQGEYPYADTFHTLGSYLIYRLTGENVCHITTAASTGLVNIYEKKWDDSVISHINADTFTFPRIAPDISVCGNYGGIPVYPDIGDHTVTVLGAIENEDDTVITVGTAGLIASVRNEYMPDVPENEIRPFFDNKYLNVICQLPGGRNLDVLWNFCTDVLAIGESHMAKNDFIHKVCDALTNADVADYPRPVLSLYGNPVTCVSFFALVFDELAMIYAKPINSAHRNGNIIVNGGAIAENRFFADRLAAYTGRKIKQCKTKDPEIDGLLKLCELTEKRK